MIRELERMSEDAYENKKAYNREYAKERAKKLGLKTFAATLDKDKAKEIDEYISKYNMTRLDLLEFGLEQLKKER